MTEKESLTLFLSDSISPPSDSAKLSKIFEIDALIEQFYSTKIRNLSSPKVAITKMEKL